MWIDRRITLWLLLVAGVAAVASHQTQPARAQSVPATVEQVALFSACSQAADAAKEVQTKANAWLSDHRTVSILHREMFTAPCPGVTEYGSVAITLAIHYVPPTLIR